MRVARPWHVIQKRRPVSNIGNAAHRHRPVEGRRGIRKPHPPVKSAMSVASTAGHRHWFRYLLLAVALLTTAAAVAAAMAVGHLRRHPEAVAGLVERVLSRQTGARVSIGRLHYAFDPLQLSLADVTAESGEGENGVALAVPVLEARMTLAGPFGERVLTITRLSATGFVARLRGDAGFFRPPTAPSPSVFSRLLLRLVRYFLVSEVRFEKMALSDGRLEYRSAVQGGRLNELSVSSDSAGRLNADGEIDWHWQAADSALTGGVFRVEVTASGFSVNRPLEARLRLERAALATPQVAARDLEGELQLTYDFGSDRIEVHNARLQARIGAAPGTALPLPDPLSVSLTAAGDVGPATGRIDVSRWHLVADRLGEGTGSAAFAAGDAATLQLDIADSGLNIEPLLAAVGKTAGRGPLPLTAAGRLAVAGRIRAAFAQGHPQWQGDLTARLKDTPFSFRAAGLTIDGRLSGRIRAAGDLGSPRLEADLQSARTRLATDGVRLAPFGAAVKISGRHPSFTFAVNGTLPSVTIGSAGDRFRLSDLNVRSGEGRFQADTGWWAFDHGSVSAATLGDLALAAGRSPDGLRLALSGDGSRLLQTLAGMAGLPADWQVDLQESFRLSTLVTDAGPIRLFGIFELSDGGFSSPDGSRLAEHIAARLSLEARLATGDGGLHAEVSLAAGKGEILWDRAYVNLAATPLAVAGSAVYRRQSQGLELDGWRLELANLAAVMVDGRMVPMNGRTDMELTLRIPDTDAAALFRQLVVEPYRFEHPTLETLQVSGRLGAELAVQKSSNGWRVKGRCAWRNGRFADAAGTLSAEGIFVDLPVWYDSTPNRLPAAPLRGTLKAAALRLPLLAEQPLELTVEVTPNTIAVAGTTTLDSVSGPLRFGPVTLQGVFSPAPTLTTDLEIGPLGTDALIGDLWPRATGGRLSGHLDPVRFADNRLSGRGEAVLGVFGGRIRISDPALDGLLGGSPLLSFDALVQDLNLGELTDQTAFGKIEGILQGRVDHVEIVHGQPQRFDLMLETVRRAGVPRKINVRAVENIAHLGGGQSPFIGMAGRVAAWFDKFSYDRIGVRATLENDVFRVNGTIKDGNREYLVKRGGIPGVDVVNLNPDNRISFKDMLKRIRRIKSGPAQPVIR
jgi:hypothetical protein